MPGTSLKQIAFAAAVAVFVAMPADAGPAYEISATGTRTFETDTLTIKVLVEAANLGSGEVEVGEITFHPGYRGSSHRHGAIEIFYVVEGVMEHVVDGEARRLIGQGGVQVDGEKQSDQGTTLQRGDSHLIKVGKRRFRKVALK